MQHQELTEEMRSRYYNPTDIEKRQKLQALLDLSYTIVCTSRPLPGEVAWEGEWCGGIHWAAGNLTQYQKMWTNLDAAIVVLVDNNKLFEIAKEKYDLKIQNPHYKTIYPTWEEACVKYTQQRLVRMLIPDAPWKSTES